MADKQGSRMWSAVMVAAGAGAVLLMLLVVAGGPEHSATAGPQGAGAGSGAKSGQAPTGMALKPGVRQVALRPAGERGPNDTGPAPEALARPPVTTAAQRLRTMAHVARMMPLNEPAEADAPKASQPANQETPAPPDGPPKGTLSKADIQNAVTNVLPDIKKCYEGGLRMKDGQGTVKVAFTLVAADGGGFMRDAEIAESGLANPVTDACVLTALSNARFPMPHGGEVRVTYPFRFDTGQEP